MCVCVCVCVCTRARGACVCVIYMCVFVYIYLYLSVNLNAQSKELINVLRSALFYETIEYVDSVLCTVFVAPYLLHKYYPNM